MQVLSMPADGLGAEEVAERLAPLLPGDLGLYAARCASASFHAAWSATGKTYRYQLPSRTSEALRRCDEALALMPGTRDFRVFHYKTSAVQPRTVGRAERQGEMVWFEGPGFGRHMVRMLVGAALAVADESVSLERVRRGLDEQENFHCPVAPAESLTLWDIRYPPEVDPFVSDRGQPAEDSMDSPLAAVR
jgi:tRNA pseudouridine38-40 synthase